MRPLPQSDDVLDALGSKVRRDMLAYLAEQPSNVGTLAEHFPMSRPAISKHLKILRNAGLVQSDPKGSSNIYRIEPKGFGEAVRWLEDFWDVALGRLALVAENTGSKNDGWVE